MDEINPRKRRRPALSCVQCRQRKVRCDRVYPCGPCTRARHEMPCSYTSQDGGEDATGQTASVRDVSAISGSQSETRAADEASVGFKRSIRTLNESNKDLQGRVSRLDEIIRDAEMPGAPLRVQLGNIHQSILRLEDRVSSLERQQRPPKDASGSANQDTYISPAALQLKSTPEKVKVAGQGHWSSLFHHLPLINTIRLHDPAPTDDIQTAEMREWIKKCKALRATIKSRDSENCDEPFKNLIDELPSDACIWHDMVSVYMHTLDPVYRILRCPFEFEFFDAMTDHLPMSHNFLLKALLVIGMGSVFHQDPEKRSYVRHRVRRWVHAAQWWLTGPSERSTRNLDGLEVYCLMLLCRQVHSLDKESIWIAAGSLVRFACSLGLHRDPRHFPSLGPFECERRRGLWAAVVELSLQWSFDVAMPPLISEDDFDIEPPLNFNDTQIMRHPEEYPIPLPESQFTDTTIQRFLLRSLPTRLRVARFVNQVHSPLSYERALELGSQLTTHCRELVPVPQNQRMETATFHYKLLDTILRRTILVLYRPFAIRAIHDPRFYLARKLSLESAMIIASHADSMKIPSREPENYASLAISGAGAFKGPLSLDVILVICLELTTQLQEETKTRPHPRRSATILDRMGQATRKPLIETLEHIQEQLLQVIAMGIPSMKRYAILTTVLGQVKAMQEKGEFSNQVVYESLMGCVRDCSTLLGDHIEETTLQSEDNSGGDLVEMAEVSDFYAGSLVSYACYLLIHIIVDWC